MIGRIIKQVSNDYTVFNGKNYICKARGVFRNLKETPLVGDMVEFDENKKIILKIKDRKNFLVRPSISNVDQALIVTSVKNPDFSSILLDKLLTIIEFNNIEPIICFTKLDLLNKEELKIIKNYMDYYETIGYKVITNESRNLKNLFKNKITVFTGQSGAGKSSLLNQLDSNLHLKTDDISYALNRGKHTTRHTELFNFDGGMIADTPGFSAIDMNELKPIEIRDNMKEMFNALEHCKYRDCMHVKEDGCYILNEIKKNKILKERHENYLNFLGELWK